MPIKSIIKSFKENINSFIFKNIEDNNIPIKERLDLITKLKDKDYIKAIRNGNALLLSVAKPNAGFNVGMAMQRNRYIYALSEATAIVKSDLDKGGTWAGAIDNLKNKVTDSYIWNNTKYPGNKELINRGIIPIDENWDMNIKKIEKAVKEQMKKDEIKTTQMSLFD